MKTPTEEQIAEMQQAALAASGRAEVDTLEFDAADLAVVVRPPTRAEWAAYLDAAVVPETNADARWNAVMRMSLFPSRAELAAAREQWANLPEKICDAIEELAGKAEPRKLVLDDKASVDELASFGLDVSEVAELRKKYPHPGQLRAVATPAFSCILKRPTVACFEAFHRRAAKGTGYAAACADAAIDCVVWPDEATAREAFNKYPAVPSLVLAPIVTDMGGANLEVKKKRR